MEKVSTIEEAERFFLSNSEGNCVAVNTNGEEKEVDCYPDAIEHIQSKQL